MARAAANEWDAVVMTRTAFQRVSLSPEAEASYMRTEVAQARAELEAVRDSGQENGQPSASIVKRLEKVVLARD